MTRWNELTSRLVVGLMVVSMGSACVGSGDSDVPSSLDPREREGAPADDGASSWPPPGDAGSILPEPAMPATSVATGSIENVDLDAQTLTVVENDRELRFSFSEETDVRGTAGVQGLADQEGTIATVTYREEGGTMIAEQVVVLQ